MFTSGWVKARVGKDAVDWDKDDAGPIVPSPSEKPRCHVAPPEATRAKLPHDNRAINGA